MSGWSKHGLAGSCLVAALALAIPGSSQSAPRAGRSACRDDIVGVGQPGDEGYRIRSVRIGARYLSLPLPTPGTPYSPEIVTQLVEQLHAAEDQEGARESVEGGTEFQILHAISAEKGGESRVVLTDSCVQVVGEPACLRTLGPSSPKCVDIAVRAFSLRVSTASPWQNLLNLPRANHPSFLSRVPGPVLASNPKFPAVYDRRLGFSGGLELSSNLLDISKSLRGVPPILRRTRLDLTTEGRKSAQHPFYNTRARLSFSRRLPGAFDAVELGAGFDADHEPLAEGSYLRGGASIGGSLKVRPNSGPLANLILAGEYRRSSNRFFGAAATPTEKTTENGFQARLISDGHLAGGFSRLALWVDGGAPEKLPGSYRRAAALLGYAKEFVVAPNQTIGLEALAGWGRAWDAVPQYARFYGGGAAKNFLYEPSGSTLLANLPRGPLLRSFGLSQAPAGARAAGHGGTSYWHLNLNVSLPVRKWSGPLIPDISIDGIPRKDASCKTVHDSDGSPILEGRPLKAILKSQGACSKRMLQKIFEQEGLSQAEARAKAERELKGINSILAFVADQANLFSVKPLLLFDAARIGAARSLDNRTRLAAGGGLQLTMVIAKLELGYVSALRRVPGDVRGSFVARLVFQNLF